MTTIDTGSGNGRREINRELPLIPFIDFMLCLVTFLLVTAVWSQMARLDADANVAGRKGPTRAREEKLLHVKVGERRFDLEWRVGSTLVNHRQIERRPVMAHGDVTYPDLARQLEADWKAHGSHRDQTDAKLDQAVLHTSNSTPFAELVAVIDAVNATKRQVTVGGETETAPVFNVRFAVD